MKPVGVEVSIFWIFDVVAAAAATGSSFLMPRVIINLKYTLQMNP